MVRPQRRAHSASVPSRSNAAGGSRQSSRRTDGRWDTAYAGQAKAEIPPDLSQALTANPAAAAAFQQLSSANRYAIIYRLNAAKLPQTRSRKLAQYIDMLTRGEAIHPRRPRRDLP